MYDILLVSVSSLSDDASGRPGGREATRGRTATTRVPGGLVSSPAFFFRFARRLFSRRFGDLSPDGVASRENERLAEAPSARGAGTASPLTAQGRARGMASTSAASAAAATESRPPIDRLIAGGAAGALSRFTTAPIDRVKLLIQVNATSYRGGAPPPALNPSSAWSVASRIAKEEGAVALWRGTGAAVVRILPYSATTFAVFPAYVDALNAAFGVRGDDVSSGRTVAARFLAGALAGTTATVITYPLDLLHARVSAHTPVATGAAPGLHPSFASTHHHRRAAAAPSPATPPDGAAAPAKMWDHFRVALRSGGVRSLYAGIGPTLVGIVPYGGVSFATFESLKALYRKRNETTGFFSDEMPTTHKLLAGGASGFLAQTATYPLHVVRRRMQVYGGDAYPGGLFAGLRTIYETEGIRRGLFKGVGLTWIKGPVAAAVGFTANDALQSLAPEARRMLFVASRTTRDGNETTESAPRSPRSGTKKGDASPVTYIERRALVSTNAEGSKSSALESLLAGGVAGAVAKTAIAPADRVKIIFQVDSKRAFSVRDAFAVARDIVNREGVVGLWRGNGVMMARVVPYAGVSFASYPRYEAAFRGVFSELDDDALDGTSSEKQKQKGSRTSSSVATKFLAGSAAGATATAMTYPLDLMRARYAAAGAVPGLVFESADSRADSRSAVLANAKTSPPRRRLFRDLGAVFRREGLRGLYGGMTPTLLGIVPYAGISFATFETLKSRYAETRRDAFENNAGDGSIGGKKKSGDEPEMPVGLRLLFGGVAGLFAQSVTYPLDIVRRRIQVVGAAGGYVSPWRALVDIAETEGLRRGLYKGVTMNWLKGPVSVAVSFFVNDSVKAYLRERRER